MKFTPMLSTTKLATTWLSTACLCLFRPLNVASQQTISLAFDPNGNVGYSFSDNDLFRGFKLNVAEDESALRSRIFQGQTVDVPDTKSTTTITSLKSTKDIRDILDIQGSVSISYGPISGSGSVEYLESKVNSKRSASVLYRMKAPAFARKVDINSLELVEEAKGLKGSELADKYGTKFVSQITYGAQLDIIYTVTSATDMDILDIEAAIAAKIRVGPLTGELAGNVTIQQGEQSSEYQVTVKAVAVGVSAIPPPNPSFDDINEFIEEFNAKYDALVDELKEKPIVDLEENVLKQLSPIAITLESISDKVPTLDALEVAALDSRMNALQDTFLEALFWSGRIEKSLNEVQNLYGRNAESRTNIFAPFRDEVQLYSDALDLKIDECLNYRRRPFEALLADTNADVPRPFLSSASENALYGLVGEAYLPTPLILEGSIFPDRFYTGYAMRTPESGNCLVPVLSGVAQSESGQYSEVRGDTPEELHFALLNGDVTYSLPGTGRDKNGLLLGAGADDGNYFVAENNGLPAQVIINPPKAWSSSDNGSSWIWQTAQMTPTDVTLRFDTYFDIGDDHDPKSARLKGKVSCDNYLSEIYINEVSTGISGFDITFLEWTPFEIDSNFKAGLNQLSFFVTDAGYSAGMRVTDLTLTIQGTKNQEIEVISVSDGGIETKSCSATIPEIPPIGGGPDGGGTSSGSPSLAPKVAYAMAFFASSSMLLL